MAIPVLKSEDTAYLDALNTAIEELRADGTLKTLSCLLYTSHTGIRILDSYFWLRRPKISAEGKATIWVTSSASSRPVVRCV